MGLGNCARRTAAGARASFVIPERSGGRRTACLFLGTQGGSRGLPGGAEGIRNDGHRSSARRRGWSSVKVCSLESEAFVIPKSQRDAVAECVEKVVLAAAASVTKAKALDLVKQMIS